MSVALSGLLEAVSRFFHLSFLHKPVAKAIVEVLSLLLVTLSMRLLYSSSGFLILYLLYPDVSDV